MLKQRLITVAVLLPLFLLAVFGASQLMWAVVIGVFIVLAAWEWAALAAVTSTGRVVFVAVLAISWCMVIANLGDSRLFGLLCNVAFGLALVHWFFVAPWWLRFNPQTPHPMVVLLLGGLILLSTGLAMVSLRQAGPWWLLGAMSVVWLADTAAYFFGKAWGKRKLAPSISPGKTWEGAIGAFAATTVFALVVAVFVPASNAAPTWARALSLVGLVLLLTGLSIVADLFESLLKRRVNLKDSGTILPGHGGILDRVDALTSTLPLAALIKLNFNWL